jgi:hypothetical protein
MSISCKYALILSTTETLENVEESLASATVTHNAFDENGSLNASSTPPGTMISAFLMALTAGAYTINLAAVPKVGGGTQDMTGLRVQAIRIKNNGANNMTFSSGAADGIALACGTIVVPPGGVTQIMLNDAAPDIAAGDKNIDVAGTLVQEAEITIIAG